LLTKKFHQCVLIGLQYEQSSMKCTLVSCLSIAVEALSLFDVTKCGDLDKTVQRIASKRHAERASNA
jgi:hypothetical protein